MILTIVNKKKTTEKAPICEQNILNIYFIGLNNNNKTIIKKTK